MFDHVREPRAKREDVRSSAEAALPPPDGKADESLIRRLERTLSVALDELSTGSHHLPDTPVGPTPGTYSRDEATQLFRSVLVALSSTDIQHVSLDRTWLGSLIKVRDVKTKEYLDFQIVPFELVDGSLERVTVASPIGRALVGTRPRDTVQLVTPAASRKVRVEELKTIFDVVDAWRLAARPELSAPR